MSNWKKPARRVGEGMRIPVLNREAATYILLRRFGYSINIIAKAFGRSTSVVYRRIKKAVELYGTLRRIDMRKMPHRIRMLAKSRQWKTLVSMLPQWEKWILGEEEEPP